MARFSPWLVVLALAALTGGVIYFGVRQSTGLAPAAPATETTTPSPAVAGTPAPKGSSPAAGIRIEGGRIEQRDPTGALVWAIVARGDLEFDKERQLVVGRSVRFEMTSKAKMPFVIEAPIFRADYQAKTIVFEQGVVGRMADGSASFRVQRATVDFNNQKLIGSGGVRFAQGPYVATAQRILVDPQAKKVRLSGGVRFERRG